MDTKAHYTLIGSAMILLLAALIVGFLWLDVGLNRPVYHTFLISMDQSVSGLNEQASVKFNGVDVGYVKAMNLNPKNPQQVMLTVLIKEGTPVTTSTHATLTPQGITGLSFISLSATTPNAPLVKISDEPPYPIIPSSPSLFGQLNSLLDEASGSLHGVSHSIQTILDAENAENFKQILVNLNTITATLAANNAAITKILAQTADASGNLPSISDNLKQSVVNLNQATNLAKEAMLPAVQLLDQLNTIGGNIESFSSDLAQNPTILIRGKSTNHNLGPGE